MFIYWLFDLNQIRFSVRDSENIFCAGQKQIYLFFKAWKYNNSSENCRFHFSWYLNSHIESITSVMNVKRQLELAADEEWMKVLHFKFCRALSLWLPVSDVRPFCEFNCSSKTKRCNQSKKCIIRNLVDCEWCICTSL